MPVLSNARHERFAQELAKGKSATEAYELAGFEAKGASARVNASRLLTNANVQSRVQELQNRASARTEVTLASLLQNAEEARKLAMDLGQPSAAVAAIKEMGVLAGVRVEKRENTNRNLSDLSDDELAAIAFGGSEGVTAQAGGPTLSH